MVVTFQMSTLNHPAPAITENIYASEQRNNVKIKVSGLGDNYIGNLGSKRNKIKLHKT